METTRRKSRLLPVLLAIALVCATLAIYAAGYLYGSVVFSGQGFNARCFRSKWLCVLYLPAARLETAWTGAAVSLAYEAPNSTATQQAFNIYP